MASNPANSNTHNNTKHEAPVATHANPRSHAPVPPHVAMNQQAGRYYAQNPHAEPFQPPPRVRSAPVEDSSNPHSRQVPFKHAGALPRATPITAQLASNLNKPSSVTDNSESDGGDKQNGNGANALPSDLNPISESFPSTPNSGASTVTVASSASGGDNTSVSSESPEFGGGHMGRGAGRGGFRGGRGGNRGGRGGMRGSMQGGSYIPHNQMGSPHTMPMGVTQPINIGRGQFMPSPQQGPIQSNAGFNPGARPFPAPGLMNPQQPNVNLSSPQLGVNIALSPSLNAGNNPAAGAMQPPNLQLGLPMGAPNLAAMGQPMGGLGGVPLPQGVNSAMFGPGGFLPNFPPGQIPMLPPGHPFFAHQAGLAQLPIMSPQHWNAMSREQQGNYLQIHAMRMQHLQHMQFIQQQQQLAMQQQQQQGQAMQRSPMMTAQSGSPQSSPALSPAALPQLSPLPGPAISIAPNIANGPNPNASPFVPPGNMPRPAPGFNPSVPSFVPGGGAGRGSVLHANATPFQFGGQPVAAPPVRSHPYQVRNALAIVDPDTNEVINEKVIQQNKPSESASDTSESDDEEEQEEAKPAGSPAERQRSHALAILSPPRLLQQSTATESSSSAAQEPDALKSETAPSTVSAPAESASSGSTESQTTPATSTTTESEPAADDSAKTADSITSTTVAATSSSKPVLSLTRSPQTKPEPESKVKGDEAEEKSTEKEAFTAAETVESSKVEESKEDVGDSTTGGRYHYDLEFLRGFAWIRDRPDQFPSNLPSELVARAGGPARKGSGDRGQQWDRAGGQTPSARKGFSQDARSGRDVRGSNPPSSRGPGSMVRFDSGPAPTPSRGDRITRSTSGNIRELPREGRQQSAGGRDRHGRGHKAQVQEANLPPVVPLQKSSTRWEGGKGVESDMERVRKKLLSLLNKLTIDKFNTIATQIIELIRGNVSIGSELLTEAVRVVFEKAVDETYFSGMYSDLCVRISTEVADLFEDPTQPPPPQATTEGVESKPATKKRSLFRIILLNACQVAFAEGNATVDPDGLTTEEVNDKIAVQKRRMLGNIKFIGELYKKGMLVEKIMHTCIQQLLPSPELISSPDYTIADEDIESLSTLLTNIGEKIDHKRSEDLVNVYFEQLQSILATGKLASRIRFMILDVIDLRKNAWVPRNKKAEAKSKEQIRAEAEADAAAKAAKPGPVGGQRGPNAVTMLNSGGGRVAMPRAVGGAQDVRMLGSSTALAGSTASRSVTSRDRYSQVVGGPQLTNPPVLAPAGRPSGTSPQVFGSLRPQVSLAPQGKSAAAGRQAPAKSAPAPPSAGISRSPSASPTPEVGLSRSQSTSSLVGADEDTLDKQSKSIIKDFLRGGAGISDLRSFASELQGTQSDLRYLLVASAFEAGVERVANIPRIDQLLRDLDGLDSAHFDRGLVKYLPSLSDDYIVDDNPAAVANVAKLLTSFVKEGLATLAPLNKSLRHLEMEGVNIAARIFQSLVQDHTLSVQQVADIVELSSFDVANLFPDYDELKAQWLHDSTLALRPSFPLVLAMPTLKPVVDTAVATSFQQSHVPAIIAVLEAHSQSASSPLFVRSLVRLVLDSPASIEQRVSLISLIVSSLASHPSLAHFTQQLEQAHVFIIRSVYNFAVAASSPSQFATIIVGLSQSKTLPDARSRLSEWRESVQSEPWIDREQLDTAFAEAEAAV